MVASETIEDFTEDTRTHKIYHAITEVCHRLDLSEPLWLDSNISEFHRRARTRFGASNFIESIDFDYLEIHVLDEDY